METFGILFCHNMSDSCSPEREYEQLLSCQALKPPVKELLAR
jgi:hypothetical protein